MNSNSERLQNGLNRREIQPDHAATTLLDKISKQVLKNDKLTLS
jgi:hypothetical protein